MTEPRSRPIAGRLEGVGIPDLLWLLSEKQRTGLLRIECDGMDTVLHFEEGRIIFATSTDPNNRLGVHLLRQGLVTLDQLEHAADRCDVNHKLGQLLVEDEVLSHTELISVVLDQIRSTVLELFSLRDGGYYFEEQALPNDQAITLGCHVKELILMGIKQVNSQTLLRKNVGSAGTVFGLTADWIEALDGLELSEGDELLVKRLEHGEQSLQELCAELILSSFEIYQTLWSFKVLGVVEEVDPTLGSDQSVSHDQIPLENEGFVEFLLRLSAEGETGVLQANRAGCERAFHLQLGQCIFATSSDQDDGLVSFLLRRGVISLQHREETARRLLTNRRVGAILREMGVIDDEDLREMVREHLCEILWDTFRWEHGEFSFVRRTLPSNEEIILDQNVESLVIAGVQRIRSWPRLEQGCGGLDSVLGLTSDYLNILDATEAGPDEWAVISSLTEPKTPREICRNSDLPDFRIIQILWGLKILGGLEEVERAELPAEEAAPEPDPILEEGQLVQVVDLDQQQRPQPQEEDVVEDELIEPAPVEIDEPEELPVEVTTLAIPQADVASALVGEEKIEATPEPEFTEDVSLDATIAIDREEVEAVLASEHEIEDEIEDQPEEQPEDTEELAEPEVMEAVSPEATIAIDREEVETALEEPEQDDAPAEESPEPDAVATQALNAEEVAAALADVVEEPQIEADEPATTDGLDSELESSDAEAEPAPEPEPDEDPWEPPEDLAETIRRFNDAQRIIYRTVKMEVGAGAANFIKACCGDAARESGHIWQEDGLKGDGSWDTDGLRTAVLVFRIDDPWSEFLWLIEKEIESLQFHIGEQRALELKRSVFD